MENIKNGMSNGQLKSHCFCNDGKCSGEYKEWYDNGRLCNFGFYINGKLKESVKNGMIMVIYIPMIFNRYGLCEGERKEWSYNGELIYHGFFIASFEIDSQFNVHKKHNWINRLRKFQYKINLHKLNSILNVLIPLEMVKICAKY